MKRRYPLMQNMYPALANPAPAGQATQPKQAAIRPSVSLKNKSRPSQSTAARAQNKSGELVDFIVYGVDEDDQTQEIHLAFRDDVVRGVYLKLRFEAAGLRAIFLVNDKSARRWARAYGEQILARLEKKGLKTSVVEIIDSDEKMPER